MPDGKNGLRWLKMSWNGPKAYKWSKLRLNVATMLLSQILDVLRKLWKLECWHIFPIKVCNKMFQFSEKTYASTLHGEYKHKMSRRCLKIHLSFAFLNTRNGHFSGIYGDFDISPILIFSNLGWPKSILRSSFVLEKSYRKTYITPAKVKILDVTFLASWPWMSWSDTREQKS